MKKDSEKIAVSRWISPKRTRSYPYERVYDTLAFDGKKVTIIPVVKDEGLLSAYDTKDGKAVYEAERVGSGGQYYSSLVTANGHLYLTALNGDVHVVKTGEVPEVVYKGKLNERTAATPAIVGDRLSVRTATKLYAFSGR